MEKRVVLRSSDGRLGFELRQGSNLLGRDPERCQVILRSSRSISLVHADLDLSFDDYGEPVIVFKDTNSTNGTFVNDTHISGRRQPTIELRDGDVLRFGYDNSSFLLRVEDATREGQDQHEEKVKLGEELPPPLDQVAFEAAEGKEHHQLPDTIPGPLSAESRFNDHEYAEGSESEIESLFGAVSPTVAASSSGRRPAATPKSEHVDVQHDNRRHFEHLSKQIKELEQRLPKGHGQANELAKLERKLDGLRDQTSGLGSSQVDAINNRLAELERRLLAQGQEHKSPDQRQQQRPRPVMHTVQASPSSMPSKSPGWAMDFGSFDKRDGESSFHSFDPLKAEDSASLSGGAAAAWGAELAPDEDIFDASETPHAISGNISGVAVGAATVEAPVKEQADSLATVKLEQQAAQHELKQQAQRLGIVALRLASQRAQHRRLGFAFQALSRAARNKVAKVKRKSVEKQKHSKQTQRRDASTETGGLSKEEKLERCAELFESFHLKHALRNWSKRHERDIFKERLEQQIYRKVSQQVKEREKRKEEALRTSATGPESVLRLKLDDALQELRLLEQTSCLHELNLMLSRAARRKIGLAFREWQAKTVARREELQRRLEKEHAKSNEKDDLNTDQVSKTGAAQSSELGHKFKQLSEERDRLSEAVKKLSAEKATAWEANHGLRERVSAFESELQALHDHAQESSLQITSHADRQVNTLQERLKSLSAEHDQVSQERDTLDTKVLALQRQLKEARRKQQLLQANHEDSLGTARDAQGQDLVEKNKVLRRQQQDALNAASAAESSRDQALEELEHLRRQFRASQDNAEAAEKRLAVLLDTAKSEQSLAEARVTELSIELSTELAKARNREAQLSKDLKEATARSERLSDDVTSWTQKLSDQESANEARQDRVEQKLGERVAQLQRECNESLEQLKAQRAELSSARAENSELRKQLRRLETESESERTAASREVEKTQLSLSKFESQVAALQDELASNRGDLQSAQAQLAEKNRELEKERQIGAKPSQILLDQNLESWREESDALNTKNKHLVQQVRALERDVGRLERNAHAMEGKFKAEQDQSDKVQADLREKLAQTTEELHSAKRKALSQAKQMEQAFREKLEKEAEEKDSEKRNELEKERVKREKLGLKLQEELAGAREEMQSAKRQVVAQSKQIESLERKFLEQTLSSKHSTVSNEEDKARQREVQQLQRQQALSESDAKRLRDKAGRLEEEMERLREQGDEAQKKLVDDNTSLAKELDETRRQKEKAQRRLATVEKERDTLCARLEAKNAKLHDDVAHLEERLDATKTELRLCKADNKILSKEQNDIKGKLAKNESRLSSDAQTIQDLQAQNATLLAKARDLGSSAKEATNRCKESESRLRMMKSRTAAPLGSKDQSKMALGQDSEADKPELNTLASASKDKARILQEKLLELGKEHRALLAQHKALQATSAISGQSRPPKHGKQTGKPPGKTQEAKVRRPRRPQRAMSESFAMDSMLRWDGDNESPVITGGVPDAFGQPIAPGLEAFLKKEESSRTLVPEKDKSRLDSLSASVRNNGSPCHNEVRSRSEALTTEEIVQTVLQDLVNEVADGPLRRLGRAMELFGAQVRFFRYKQSVFDAWRQVQRNQKSLKNVVRRLALSQQANLPQKWWGFKMWARFTGLDQPLSEARKKNRCIALRFERISAKLIQVSRSREATAVQRERVLLRQGFAKWRGRQELETLQVKALLLRGLEIWKRSEHWKMRALTSSQKPEQAGKLPRFCLRGAGAFDRSPDYIKVRDSGARHLEACKRFVVAKEKQFKVLMRIVRGGRLAQLWWAFTVWHRGVAAGPPEAVVCAKLEMLKCFGGIKRCLLRQQRLTLRRGFHRWESSVRVDKFLALGHAGWHAKSRARAAFVMWKDRTARNLSMRRRYVNIMRCQGEYKILQLCFSSWASKIRRRKRLNVLGRRKALQLQRTFLNKWTEFVRTRTVAYHFAGRLGRKRLRTLFASWKAVMERAKLRFPDESKRLLRRVVLRMKHGTMRMAWQRWFEVFVITRAKAQAKQKVSGQVQQLVKKSMAMESALRRLAADPKAPVSSQTLDGDAFGLAAAGDETLPEVDDGDGNTNEEFAFHANAGVGDESMASALVVKAPKHPLQPKTPTPAKASTLVVPTDGVSELARRDGGENMSAHANTYAVRLGDDLERLLETNDKARTVYEQQQVIEALLRQMQLLVANEKETRALLAQIVVPAEASDPERAAESRGVVVRHLQEMDLLRAELNALRRLSKQQEKSSSKYLRIARREKAKLEEELLECQRRAEQDKAYFAVQLRQSDKRLEKVNQILETRAAKYAKSVGEESLALLRAQIGASRKAELKAKARVKEMEDALSSFVQDAGVGGSRNQADDQKLHDAVRSLKSQLEGLRARYGLSTALKREMNLFPLASKLEEEVERGKPLTLPRLRALLQIKDV
ncbi:Cingulin-like protein 1 (Junction-associated coiled-coil protein) (Paracingulin) [Durusdinium trenchii]|uniref:Cingulin-like protein 1 (Junction-associated coiled-coil protein) (Paracingulin) n=1 Tax=Durusdinium trenchii TaxID=1381693 RepID=A0ABP0Q5J6_9DINO